MFVVLGPGCDMWDLLLAVHRLQLWHVGSVVAVHRLQYLQHEGSLDVACRVPSCGVRALECASSVVVAHGLSCSATCWILVP